MKIFALLILTSFFATAMAEDSTVVFMRSSFVGSAIKSSVYEVTDDKTIFIGILKNKKKINYKASPGKHTFMVVSEAADFMQADIAEDKTYYSIITPRMGAWKARFSISPVRTDGTGEFNTDNKKVKKVMKKVKLVEMSDKSLSWYEKHKDNIEKKRLKYWPKWQEKSAADIAERTLNTSDGI